MIEVKRIDMGRVVVAMITKVGKDPFPLQKRDLQARIDNMEKDGRDTRQEHAAMAEISRQESLVGYPSLPAEIRNAYGIRGRRST